MSAPPSRLGRALLALLAGSAAASAQSAHPAETPAPAAAVDALAAPAGGGAAAAVLKGGYAPYGTSCGGSGTAQDCLSLNGSGGTLTGLTFLNEYAYGIAAPSAMKIIGFRLFTAESSFATTTPAYSACSVFLESSSMPGVPEPIAAAEGSIEVWPTPAFYDVYLNNPLDVAAGTQLWISQQDSFNILASDLTAGTRPTVSTYWRRSNQSWQPSLQVQYPAWRLICAGGSTVPPVLSNAGLPVLNKTFQVVLAQAAPNAQALLSFGASDSVWNGLQLPWSLATIGAPGCSIHAALDLVLGGYGTGPYGTATASVPVPNDPALGGAAFYNQWFVVDPWTPLGLVASNGGRGIIGTR